MSASKHPLARQIRVLIGVGAFALGAAAFAGFQLANSPPRFNGTPYPDTPPAPAFELMDHTGALTTLDDFRGTPVLLFFGYTACPDFCPLTLSRLSEIVQEGGSDLEEVRIALVTVDPETDTPERLASYVRRFGPHVMGLTGDPDELKRIFQAYGVYAHPQAGHNGEPTLAHSTIVFGIDRGGRMQVLIHPEEAEELVAADVRMLAEIEG